jgi:peptidoglycan/LPS O-acetylase OafA/YrhL
MNAVAANESLAVKRSSPGAVQSTAQRTWTSRALENMRGFTILFVLAFHSVLAYLKFLPLSPFAFDHPPYLWRAFAIVDSVRWFGFDLFCAWLDIYLMELFFFLSGLFVWPSLRRKGTRRYLYERGIRLGLPFALAVGLLMPLAHYPTFLQTASTSGLAVYWRYWLALPFWPVGPMWFIWLLLAFDVVAVLLYAFPSRWLDVLIRALSTAGRHPGQCLAGLVFASALAYVPMAIVFTPNEWIALGPFGLQASRPLHYAVYFLAGVGIGAGGLDCRLLAPDGPLARRWVPLLAAALLLFVVWMAATAPTMPNPAAAPLPLRILAALSFVLAAASNSFAVFALCLRHAGRRLPPLRRLSRDAYGIYLIHYPIVVWLQFALLGLSLAAIVKGMTVFGGTLLLSWGTATALRHWFGGTPQPSSGGR